MPLVRLAELADASAVAEIGRVAVQKVYEGIISPETFGSYVRQAYSDDAIAAVIKRYESDPAAHLLVAEEDGRITGFLQYDEAGDEPELHRLYLDPALTGRKTGSALMRALHERLAPGRSYVLLVVEANEGAVRFYKRLELTIEQRLMGIPYYSAAGIDFPEGADDFACLVMRYRT